MRALLAALLLAGCYNPGYEDCAISCAQSNACPSGLSCIEGVCRSSTGACGSDDAGVGTWQFRKRITLAGGQVGEVTDFPVAIRLPTDQDLANFAQTHGEDIRFTTLDGIKLAHEIERYDPAKGTLAAWVKVPTLLQAPGATELYMLYGNPMAPDQQDARAVWSNDFLGVWHMSDGPGDAIADSTGKLPGTKLATNAPSPAPAGIIGASQVFAGGVDAVDIGAIPELDSRDLTLEMWVNLQDNTAGYRSLFVWPNGFANRIMVLYPGSALPTGDTKNLIIQAGASSHFGTPSMSMKARQWIHLAIVPGEGTAVAPPNVYINGTRQDATSFSMNIPAQNTHATFGGDALGNRAADGLIDEVRISKSPRSPAWIAATYQSERDDGFFLSIGAAETNPN